MNQFWNSDVVVKQRVVAARIKTFVWEIHPARSHHWNMHEWKWMWNCFVKCCSFVLRRRFRSTWIPMLTFFVTWTRFTAITLKAWSVLEKPAMSSLSEKLFSLLWKHYHTTCTILHDYTTEIIVIIWYDEWVVNGIKSSEKVQIAKRELRTILCRSKSIVRWTMIFLAFTRFDDEMKNSSERRGCSV